MKIYFITIILILKTFLLSQTGVEASSATSVCTEDNHCVGKKYPRGPGSDVLACRSVNGKNDCVPSGMKYGNIVQGKPG